MKSEWNILIVADVKTYAGALTWRMDGFAPLLHHLHQGTYDVSGGNRWRTRLRMVRHLMREKPQSVSRYSNCTLKRAHQEFQFHSKRMSSVQKHFNQFRFRTGPRNILNGSPVWAEFLVGSVPAGHPGLLLLLVLVGSAPPSSAGLHLLSVLAVPMTH